MRTGRGRPQTAADRAGDPRAIVVVAADDARKSGLAPPAIAATIGCQEIFANWVPQRDDISLMPTARFPAS